MPETMFRPRASPRCVDGNASVMIADELAISSAPPTPCRIRMMISQRTPDVPVIQVMLSATEKKLKIAKPALNIFTRPYMSPRRPKVTTRTAVTTR